MSFCNSFERACLCVSSVLLLKAYTVLGPMNRAISQIHACAICTRWWWLVCDTILDNGINNCINNKQNFFANFHMLNAARMIDHGEDVVCFYCTGHNQTCTYGWNKSICSLERAFSEKQGLEHNVCFIINNSRHFFSFLDVNKAILGQDVKDWTYFT